MGVCLAEAGRRDLPAGPPGRGLAGWPGIEDGEAVDVRVITADGVTRRPSDELETLLDGPGLVWIDVKYWDADTAACLGKRLNLHDRAVHDCAVRNPVAKVHTYPDQAFIVLHAPEQGRGGHVHFVELDQFVGPNWLLTVHGPMNAPSSSTPPTSRPPTVARGSPRAAAPDPACELSAALVNVLADRMRNYLITLTQQAWALEQQVTAGHVGDPEQFLEELFGVRHGLLAVRRWPRRAARCTGGMMRRQVFGERPARPGSSTSRTSSAGSPLWPTGSASTCRA